MKVVFLSEVGKATPCKFNNFVLGFFVYETMVCFVYDENSEISCIIGQQHLTEHQPSRLLPEATSWQLISASSNGIRLLIGIMVNNKGSCIPLSLLNISHNNTFIMMAQKSKTATRQQQASRATHKKNNYHQCCLEIIQWVIIMLLACRVLKSSSSAVWSTQCQCIDLIFHYFNIA